MQKPVSGESFKTKTCKRIVDFCEHWFVNNVIRPIFFLMPPVLISNAVIKQGLREQVSTTFGQTIGDFVNNSALLILISAYLYIIVIKAIYAGIAHHSKPEKELTRDDVLAILKSINTVVGDKSKRMMSYVRAHINSKDVCPREMFVNITKPDQQLSLLVVAIKGVFEVLDSSNASYRVGLLSVDHQDKKPRKWLYFEPTETPPRTSPKDLSAPSSTVSHAIKNKSIVVVENIGKELQKKSKDDRRYLQGSSKPSDQGSQLCYPITHPSTGEIEYIITIAGDKTKCLEEKYSALYGWILDHFSLRISLEHSLLILKEKTDEYKKAA